MNSLGVAYYKAIYCKVVHQWQISKFGKATNTSEKVPIHCKGDNLRHNLDKGTICIAQFYFDKGDKHNITFFI